MRIISGIHKGRRLRAPKNLPVRPTTDMAKEGLFNILSNRYDFKDCTILDLCSGTGNIAYEFCSRGAKRVYAVDKDRRCIKYIKETKEALNMPNQPLQSEVISFVENTHQTYDIIFADPPYEMDFMWFEQLIKHVFDKSLINSGGICIAEHSKHTNLSNLDHFDKSKTYGGNCFSFFEKKADL